MKRLYIESREGQVITALTFDGKLREVNIDPAESTSMVGHIILARLEVILPGQLAFVDIGTGKNAMMNVSHAIQLKKNQPVLVQVYKDPTGNKGAYVGMELKHSGRFVVLYESPRRDIGISQKINNETTRKRLRKLAEDALPKGFGIIMRTNAVGQDDDVILEDIQAMHQRHLHVTARAKHSTFPNIIYPETVDIMSPPLSLIADMTAYDLTEIWISGLEHDRIKHAIARLVPSMANNIHHYDNPDGRTLLAANNITPQISAALKKTVQLPCGGFVTIEQTEACVVIDVNTGRYTGQKDFRTTVLKTNLEAAECIAWQLALRNLSGIIIVDFIDMKNDQDKSALLDALREAVNKDRIKTEVVGITELGLVQLTRKRTREPLARILTQDCPKCGGIGRV